MENEETKDAAIDIPLTPTELAIPPPLPSSLHKIFVGKDGFRAAWSLLIFIAMFAMLVFSARTIAHKLHPPGPKSTSVEEITPMIGLLGEGISFFVVLLLTWIMSKIERRPISVYGLGGDRKLARFFAGLGWGAVCLSLLVLTLWKAGFLVFDNRLLFGGNVLRYAALWLVGFLFVGLFEEYLTRGFVQYTLARGLAGLYQWLFKTRHSSALGFWTSAIILSVLFGLGHGDNVGESPIGLFAAGLAALVFCLSLWRTGSLWWAVGFHASWDWSQSFLYGVADSGVMVQHHLLSTHPVGKPLLSGGTTGPEGSIFVIAILALASFIIIWTLRRAHHGQTLSSA